MQAGSKGWWAVALLGRHSTCCPVPSGHKAGNQTHCTPVQPKVLSAGGRSPRFSRTRWCARKSLDPGTPP
eukprot:5935649-Amphidinium_carterae.1